MTAIQTKEDFSAFVQKVEESPRYQRPAAFGLCVSHLNSQGQPLDAWFPVVNYEEYYGAAAVFFDAVAGSISLTNVHTFTAQAYRRAMESFAPFDGESGHVNIDVCKQLWAAFQHREDKHPSTMRMSVVFVADLTAPPQTVEDAYLRLHLLSMRKVKPHGLNLQDIFQVLPNNVWTSEGPIAEIDFAARQMSATTRLHPLHVHARDRFPRMLDYVVPSGVRIANGATVRLGAYLGEGTVVMHAGFVNFNAGTEGPNMIEGRVSAGVMVGAHSDVGGGASIMGTLSGGGKEVISIGEHCLIGANAGTGISLGDNCTIEAGTYVTAGAKVRLLGDSIVKAKELSGASNMLFRRNSTTGELEMLDKANTVELNAALHKN